MGVIGISALLLSFLFWVLFAELFIAAGGRVLASCSGSTSRYVTWIIVQAAIFAVALLGASYLFGLFVDGALGEKPFAVQSMFAAFGLLFADVDQTLDRWADTLADKLLEKRE